MNTIVVTDVRLYRDGLESALRQDGRVEVLATATSAEEALVAVREHAPATVLLDVQVEGALEAIASIVESHPRTRVIALALSQSEADIIACAEAGIAGYVSREGSIEDLVQSVDDATHGRFECSDRMAAALLEHVHRLALNAAGDVALLTPRERQIAALLQDGLSNKEIAIRLCIEVATVKNHVHKVLDKLGAKSRAEAAARLGRRRDAAPVRAAPAIHIARRGLG